MTKLPNENLRTVSGGAWPIVAGEINACWLIQPKAHDFRCRSYARRIQPLGALRIKTNSLPSALPSCTSRPSLGDVILGTEHPDVGNADELAARSAASMHPSPNADAEKGAWQQPSVSPAGKLLEQALSPVPPATIQAVPICPSQRRFRRAPTHILFEVRTPQ